MAIILKEYLESPVTFVDNSSSNISINESFNSDSTISKDSIMVDIEGIHAGPTKNFTWYMDEALISSQKSWSEPYNKRLILFHNEKNGKIIGKVMKAKYINQNTRSNTGALLFSCNVSDKEAKEGVLDGRLETVSIGVIANKVVCSICGQDITEEGRCEHERGEIYDGERCYWKIYDMEAKELSYVIVPSDIYAHNVKIYKPNVNNFTESLNENKGDVLDVAVKTKKNETDNVEVVEVKESLSQDEITILQESVITLTNENKELKGQVEKLEKENKNLTELKENAETELINVNAQLKEMAISQILFLREQLNKPETNKEKFESRNQDSLLDTILDLTEELNDLKNSNVGVEEIQESEENNEKEEEKFIKEDNVPDKKENLTSNTINETNNGINVAESLEKVQANVLVDADKDKLNDEKKLDKVGKEELQESNTINVKKIDEIKRFYEI